MHNPLHQQLQQQEQLQPTCATATGSPDYGRQASNTYTFTPSVVLRVQGLVTANSGTYTFTQTNAAGCTRQSSSIVVNAQPATPAAPTAGTVTRNMFKYNSSFQITGYRHPIRIPFTP
jgi:hypothetical protein